MRRSPAEVVRELARRQLELEKEVARLRALVEGAGWDEPMDDIDLSSGGERNQAAEVSSAAESTGWARREVEPGIFEYRSPLDERHRAFREQLAGSLAWVDWTRPTSDDGPQPITPEVGIPAFVEGGALWLYDYDRDFVMWHLMNPAILQAMVADVLYCGDRRTAEELSADLLKDRDQGPMGDSDGTLDQMRTFTGNGLNGGVQGTGFGGGGRRQ